MLGDNFLTSHNTLAINIAIVVTVNLMSAKPPDENAGAPHAISPAQRGRCGKAGIMDVFQHNHGIGILISIYLYFG